MDDEFSWEDPPPLKRSDGLTYNRGANTNITANLAKLQASPGKWARVARGGGEGIKVRTEKYTDEGCEVRIVKRVPDGAVRKLYARWVG